jgi:hypothetical protein
MLFQYLAAKCQPVKPKYVNIAKEALSRLGRALLFEVPNFDVHSSEHNRTILDFNTQEAILECAKFKLAQPVSLELLTIVSLAFMGYDGNPLKYLAEADKERAFHRELLRRILSSLDSKRSVNDLAELEL